MAAHNAPPPFLLHSHHPPPPNGVDVLQQQELEEEEEEEEEAALVEHLVGKFEALPLRFVLPAQHRPGPASTPASSAEEIPVIDLSGLHDAHRVDTLAQIHRTCSEWGFFQAINHGVPQLVLRRMEEEVEQFLSLPIHERAPNGVRKGAGGQGYGSRYVKPDTGAMDWRDFFMLLTFPESIRDYTAWPCSAAFREALLNFCDEMKKLSETLLASCSENLGLHPGYIEEAIGELHQIFQINCYHPCPQPDLAIGANKHTDLGALTCLWQSEDVVGLQVLKDGEWVPVRPIPGAIVINVGDQVEILSNGIYKSVQHRVVVNRSRRRISIAAFYGPHLDTIVKPAPELVDADHPALYPPTLFREHAGKIAFKDDKIEESAVAGN